MSTDPIKRKVIFAGEPSCTLYLGDCLEILPLVGKLDAVVTDPPYGIGYVHGAERGPMASRLNEMPVIGDDKPFDPSHLLGVERLLLWGANYYSSKLSSGNGERWLVWDKRCQQGYVRDQSDCELAWCRGTSSKTSRLFYHLWDGFNRASERGVSRQHPTQKPIALMEWCLGFYPDQSICDPYMGVGTTGVACAHLGRRFIGIEIDPGYFEIAVRRITEAREEVANRLPFTEPAREQQGELEF